MKPNLDNVIGPWEIGPRKDWKGIETFTLNDFISNNPIMMCCKYQKEIDKNILRQADKEMYFKNQSIKNNISSSNNDNPKRTMNEPNDMNAETKAQSPCLFDKHDDNLYDFDKNPSPSTTYRIKKLQEMFNMKNIRRDFRTCATIKPLIMDGPKFSTAPFLELQQSQQQQQQPLPIQQVEDDKSCTNYRLSKFSSLERSKSNYELNRKRVFLLNEPADANFEAERIRQDLNNEIVYSSNSSSTRIKSGVSQFNRTNTTIQYMKLAARDKTAEKFREKFRLIALQRQSLLNNRFQNNQQLKLNNRNLLFFNKFLNSEVHTITSDPEKATLNQNINATNNSNGNMQKSEYLKLTNSANSTASVSSSTTNNLTGILKASSKENFLSRINSIVRPKSNTTLISKSSDNSNQIIDPICINGKGVSMPKHLKIAHFNVN